MTTAEDWKRIQREQRKDILAQWIARIIVGGFWIVLVGQIILEMAK